MDLTGIVMLSKKKPYIYIYMCIYVFVCIYICILYI
jgi:hypothetical protein